MRSVVSLEPKYATHPIFASLTLTSDFNDNFEVHTHAMAKYLQKAYRTQVNQKFRKTTGFAFEDNESYFAKEEVTHPKYPHPCLVLAAMGHPFSEDSVGNT